MGNAGNVVKKGLLGLAGLVLAGAGAVAAVAGGNVKAMNACVDETLALLSEEHKVTEQPAGDYEHMKVYGIMNFHVKKYDIEELGNLSVMTVNAGVMQMATIVFSPAQKDLPLLSCDYMYILNNRKAYVEIYDLVKEKDDSYMEWMDKYEAVIEQYDDLTDTEASSAWYDDLLTEKSYKMAKIKDDARIRGLLLDTVKVYLEQADAAPILGAEEKTEKLDRIKTYSDRLIDEGGISTSFFKKSLGEDVTRDFFDKVFFGTESYRA